MSVCPFIIIRLKQLYRTLTGIGLIRFIFLIALISFLGIYVFLQTLKTPGSFYVTGAVLLIILMIHAKRTDRTFLRTHFEHYGLICLAEYIILTLPILVFLIINHQWIAVALLLVALSITAGLNLKIRSPQGNAKMLKLIPYPCYEWKSGMRRNGYIIFSLWMIGLGTSFFIGSVPIVLFILGIIPFSFYDKEEPYQMIIACEMSTNRFLFNKLKMQLTLFSLLAFPLVILFIIFNPQLWYIPVVEYLIFITLHIFLILARYAFYQPNEKPYSAQVYGAIGVLAGIVPILLPVIWLLSVRFFFKSQENLKPYLNDFN
jgi:hypothetical protein